MHDGEILADESLVRRLLREQFPQWAELQLHPIESAGTDHAIYRLGSGMCVRLPRIGWAAKQAEKEMQWLPRLAESLPLEVPVPLAMGEPAAGYPWRWSVGRWIEGEDASSCEPDDVIEMAEKLAGFIVALRSIAADGAPLSSQLGLRGAPLATRDEATRRAISQLADVLDTDRAMAVWEESLAAPEWTGPPTWHHGDLLPGNLIIRDGRLVAIIDFGGLGAGDPACDLIAAWSVFSGESREAFRRALETDDAMWARGRGHALSQAVIYIPYYRNTNPAGVQVAMRQVEAVLNG
jgi:aminoglycoside phosphotransferase (APT) family kinase protein